MRRSPMPPRQTPLKRGGRLRPFSKKKRAEIADNRDWRRAFIAEFGFCMVCGAVERLEVHEMTPGHANRPKAVSNREACLVVCRTCNQDLLPGIPLADQLAVKLANDMWFFSLDAIRAIRNNGRNPIVVTMEDVRKAAVGLGFTTRSDQ